MTALVLVDDLPTPVELCGRPAIEWARAAVDRAAPQVRDVPGGVLVVRASTPLLQPATLRRLAAAVAPGATVVPVSAPDSRPWWASQVPCAADPTSPVDGARPVEVPGIEALSIADPLGHATAERALYELIAARWLDRGVVIEDPSTTRIDWGVRLGAGVRIRSHTELTGATIVGDGCLLGPMVSLHDSRLDADCQVRYSVCQNVSVGARGNVGPFAWLRSGTVLGDGCRAGAFVELADSIVGDGTSVPHLAGLFSADVGRDCNLASMSGPANFDGFRKQRVSIGDGASIGAGSILVAPVSIGAGASTAAGSIITEDVPDGALAVARVPQRNVPGWGAAATARRRLSA